MQRNLVMKSVLESLPAVFAILAIVISCLGLFGLASFIAEQRKKEIGVRKVLGASVFNVWNLLSKDFVKLVIISFIIAVPLAYYFMHNWLQNYKLPNAIIMVDFCSGCWCIIDYNNSCKLASNKSSNCKPCEEFKNGIIT